MTNPELTKEQQQALDQNDGIVEGPSFVIMRTDVFRSMLGFGADEDLQRQLQVGFDQADRGQLVGVLVLDLVDETPLHPRDLEVRLRLLDERRLKDRVCVSIPSRHVAPYDLDALN